MRSFFMILMSIFFDISTQQRTINNLYNPQDLTDHYNNEITDMALDGVFIATHYKDVRDSIEAYKYRSDRQYVGQYVDLLAKIGEEYIPISECPDITIVGIPMHWSRYIIRGFNHIDLLTCGVSRKLGIVQQKPIQALFSKRQSKLSKTKRMKNREGTFVLHSGGKLPDSIILIDDIISTGSTANTCARILKDAGVKNVYVICIASNQ